jgi:hypothetical protein
MRITPVPAGELIEERPSVGTAGETKQMKYLEQKWSSAIWICAWHATPTPTGFAEIVSRSHDAVIRVYDTASNVIETHKHQDEFLRTLN